MNQPGARDSASGEVVNCDACFAKSRLIREMQAALNALYVGVPEAREQWKQRIDEVLT